MAEQPPGKGYAAPPPVDFKSTLILRRAADGTVRIQGTAPDRHVFPASFINRELDAGAVEVHVTLHTGEGPVVYLMDGFEPYDSSPFDPDRPGKRNLSGWICTRVDR